VSTSSLVALTGLLAGTALVVPVASAGSYSVANGGDLTTTITQSNTDGDANTDITLTQDVNVGSGTVFNVVTNPINVTIDTAGHTLTLDGPGTVWNAGSDFTFNVDGTAGGLTISNGAQLQVNDAPGGPAFVSVLSGNLKVSGPGSSLTTTYLALGRGGNATLELTNGATLTTSGVASLGEDANNTAASNITVLVDGAGTVWNAGSFAVGGAANSVDVMLSGRAAINAEDAAIGQNGVGTMTVSGAGTEMAISGLLEIGAHPFGPNAGQGTLTINNGGLVSALGGVIIGADDPASGGTLRVNTNGILETPALLPDVGSATVEFDNGTLRATADSAPDSALIYGFAPDKFSIGPGGMFLDSNGFNVTATTVISGVGALTKLGEGTLTLTEDNTYAGGTKVAAGTLQLGNGGTSGSIKGNVDVGGVLAFDRSDTVSFDGTISGTGAVSQVGTGATRLASGNTYTGGTTITAGTLIGSANSFGTGAIVDNAALVIDQPADADFANTISGTGNFTKQGAGQLTYTGTADLTGPTNVGAGTLAVTGSLARSAVTVQNGATLAGNGTVGATRILTGGTIAPKVPAGTLTVNGDFAQQTGSTYQVQVDPNSNASTQVVVNGAATLSGGSILNVTKSQPGGYRPGARYTVMTATGGLTGTYALTGQTDGPRLSAFLGLVDSYDADHAYLGVAQVRGVTEPAKTPNQVAAAGAVDTLPAGNPVSGAVLNVPTDDSARQAFDQLSSDGYASTKTALINNSRLLRDAADARLLDVFCADGGDTTRNRQHPRDTDCNPDHKVAWTQTLGSWGHTNGDGNAGALNTSTGGVLIGMDVPVAANWRVGGLAGYSNTHIDARNVSTSSNNYHLGAYGGTQLGALGFRAGAAYTWSDMSAKRSVAFPGYTNQLRADPDAGTAQAFAELGYRLDAGRVAIEPFANLAYVSLHSDGYTERGGDAALTSHADDTNATISTLGVRPSMQMELGTVQTTLHGMIGWRHAFGDVTPTNTASFAGGGNTFTVSAVPIARDTAAVEVGLEMKARKNLSVTLSYGGQFSGSANDQSIKGELVLRF
jgi:outer membrane autotransporter protein